MRTTKIRLPLLSLVIVSFMLTGCGLNPFQSKFWENSILANLIQAFTGSVGAPAGSQAKQEGAKSQLVGKILGKVDALNKTMAGFGLPLIDSADGFQYYRDTIANHYKVLDWKLQNGIIEVKGKNLLDLPNLPPRTFEYWKFTGTETDLDTFNGKFGEVCSLSAIVYVDSLDRRLQFWAKVITSAQVDSTDSTEENTLGDSAYISLDSMEYTGGQYLQHGSAHYYDQDGKVQIGVIKIFVDHNGTISLDDDNGRKDTWRDNLSTMEFDLTNTDNDATYRLVVTHYGPENPTAVVTEGRMRESGSAYYADGKKLLDYVKYRWVIGTTNSGDVKSSVTWYDDSVDNKKVKTVTRFFNRTKDIQDYNSGS